MNRIAKWDNAKFVLIILVVICHFYENYLGSSKLVNSLFFSVYTFHMPAFFLISGMFSKKTVKERKIVKVVPYLLVYLFMKMFGYFVSGIMNGGTFISVDFFREPGCRLVYSCVIFHVFNYVLYQTISTCLCFDCICFCFNGSRLLQYGYESFLLVEDCSFLSIFFYWICIVNGYNYEMDRK